MAEVNPPLGLQTAGIKHNALLVRRAFGGVLGEGVAVYNTLGDMLVKPNSPAGMSVLVQRGGAWVNGDDILDQGLYFCYNDADDVSTLTASDPTNPRIDLIVAHVKDNTTGQPGDTWVLESVTGTPSVSPVAPALPASALLLAQIAVAANATSITSGNITDKRKVATLIIQSGAPTARVNRGGSQQNLPDSTDTNVNFDTVEWDYTTPFWAGGNPARLTFPQTGKYLVTANVEIDAGSGGQRRNAKIWYNGLTGTQLAESQMSLQSGSFASGRDTVLNLATIVNALAVGDYVTVSAYQDSGSTLHINPNAGGTHMEIMRLGA